MRMVRWRVLLLLTVVAIVVAWCGRPGEHVCAAPDRTLVLAETTVSHEIASASFEMPAHGRAWIRATDDNYSPEALFSTFGSLTVVPEGGSVADHAAVVVGQNPDVAQQRLHLRAGRYQVYGAHRGMTAEVFLCGS